MKQFWNDRYASDQFAYGQEPNVFFKQELDKLERGTILLPADGEGRNSVYAAKKGWTSFACDISDEGMKKAQKLAAENEVNLNYSVGDFGDLPYEHEFFDAIALIWAHFPAENKREFHGLTDRYLKVGGTIVLEAFSKNHLKFNAENPKVGGPKEIEMLYSIEEIKKDFSNYDLLTLEEIETDLNEGEFHIGRGSVARFVGRKRF
jgi:cyclopropane fatty-acyl-phospholipid synthase-like methyltransferase